MNTLQFTKIIALLLSVVVAQGAIAAKKGPPVGKGKRGGGTETTVATNLSYPVIYAEGALPGGSSVTPWTFAPTFATITDPALQCVTSVTAGTPVPADKVCYLDSSNKIWWLQKRAGNMWSAFFTIDPDWTTAVPATATPVVATGVDASDLLESSPKLNARPIRTEFTMLKNATTDPAFKNFVATAFAKENVTCPNSATVPNGCFAAYLMSGAVPGTEKSNLEMQGTDYGSDLGAFPGTRTLVDPRLVKADSVTGTGYDAIIYSSCARLFIQKWQTTEAPVWDGVKGVWYGAAAPMVNITSYPLTDPITGATIAPTYVTEINSGGSLVYGYNWMASNASTGKYRITFILDGAPVCPALNTKFQKTATAEYPQTTVANPGEVTPAQMLYPEDLVATSSDGKTYSYGGLVYVDITLRPKKGGGGKK